MKTIKDWVELARICNTDEERAEMVMLIRHDTINTIHVMVVDLMKVNRPDDCLLCGHKLAAQMRTLLGYAQDNIECDDIDKNIL